MKHNHQACIDFGIAVRMQRKKLGISQQDLAERSGLHRTYIGGIERGERNPSLTIIYHIAHALDIHPYKLLEADQNQ